jgi:hypothetical protein
MDRKKKRVVISGVILLFSIVVVALGLKYFPFSKMVKMPAGSDKDYISPEKKHKLVPNTLYYDFEVAPGKEMPGGFNKGQAHSGQYAVKAFGQNSYSVAVEKTAGEIGIGNLQAVAISAWIYVFPTKKEVKGSLVFAVSNEVGVNVSWNGLYVYDPEVPRGQWFKVSKYMDLSKVEFKPGYKIQLYFWNTSSADILVDDYFISFGGAIDRRGDSARVDMTKPAGFIAKYNFPPFPVSMMEKEPLAKSVSPSEIDPADFAIAGNFYNTGNDGLLAIGKNGRVVAYTFCQGSREFRKINISNQQSLQALGSVRKIVKGKFLPGNADQFIVIGNKGWMLGAINPPENSCSGDGVLQGNLKILWKSAEVAGTLDAGDFNGDKRAEILSVAANGSWKLMSFEPDGNKTGGSWKVLFADDQKPVDEWDQGVRETGMSVGRFLPGEARDVVLTVTRNKNDKKYAYSLRKFNPAGKNWEPVSGTKQHQAGMTIGLDTLKPADHFFAIPAGVNKTAVFRYNRDWRYDMKEIRFNDSTFTIVSEVDFHGYEKDQNPKYYESLKLVPGCYLNATTGSFFTVGSIPKSRHYQEILPDFAHLYSLAAIK